jgi:hypothetical protein
MRDPKRIPQILAKLGELWTAQPDLRLGQIMGNASITYYTEDDKAAQALQEWIEYYKEQRR